MSKIQKYIPAGPIIEGFHRSDAFVKFIMGPVGSGKSVACMMDLFARASEQKPNEDGVRRTRFAIIRNTYPELKQTTIKTWTEWFPEATFGPVKWSAPITHHLKFKLQDGTMIDSEFIFISLDKEQDNAKLLSLEITGAFINEAKEIRADAFDLLTSRVGRFPPQRDGGPTWTGVILDSNPAHIGSWLHKRFVVEKPKEWDFFHQPSGLSEHAENRENLPADYYEQIQIGKTDEYIRAYVKGQWAYSMAGKPVHPKFNPTIHVAKDVITPVPYFQTYIGFDWGSTPAACFIQFNPSINQYVVTDEIVTENAAAEDIADLVKHLLHDKYNGVKPKMFGDPAGNQPGQQRRETVFDVLWALGMDVQPASKNNIFDIRKAALDSLLNRRGFTGQEQFIVSPNCVTLIAGLSGGYAFKKVQVSGDDRFKDTPDKTPTSHICEACHYGLMGAGCGEAVLTKQEERGRQRRKPRVRRSNGTIRV